jgi:CheY-like chemotaxis protein
MPIWDGIRTLKALKVDEKYKNIPVIMFTTSQSHRDNELSLKLGAQGFITKPVNQKDLHQLYHRFAEYCRQ